MNDRTQREAYSRLLLWTRQVERLEARLRHPEWDKLVGPHDESDAIRDFNADQHFALVSLSNLWRSIRLAGTVTRDHEIRRLLQRFETELPRQKDVRDLQEHLDQYILGRGRDQELQRGFDALTTGTRPGTGFRAQSPGRGKLISGPITNLRIAIAPGVDIDILEALKTAHSIGREALALMEKHR